MERALLLQLKSVLSSHPIALEITLIHTHALQPQFPEASEVISTDWLSVALRREHPFPINIGKAHPPCNIQSVTSIEPYVVVWFLI